MTKSDNIGLDEFSEMCRKRSLDLYFPRDEQRLLFENFDGSFSSSIGVKDVIDRYDSAAPTITATSRVTEQQKRERNEKILSKINKQRERAKLLDSPRQTTLQLIRSLRNLDPNSTGYISKDELRWGLGKNYMNIPLSAEEIDTVVELCPPEKHNGLISYDKFAKMLEIKNDEPVIEPFFDARANQITRLKQRVRDIDSSLEDSNLISRRQELIEKCHRNEEKQQGKFEIDQAGGLSTLNKTISCPEFVVSSPQLTHSPLYSDRRESFLQNSQTSFHNKHFLADKKQRGKGGNQHQNSLDLTDTVHSPTHEGLMPGGKKLFHYAKFDETLLQHDMGGSGTWSNSNNSLEDPPRAFTADNDRFLTTSNSYFAPLLYRPSVPVTRPNAIGDSMQSSLKREFRRKKRFERTAKNLQSFADLKELDDISNTMNSQLRCKGRALEALQYESSAMHRDIKKFSKNQVTAMQKKPNKALYDKMWGGDKEQSRNAVDKPEDRDFTTTYGGSFALSSISPNEKSTQKQSSFDL